MSDTLINGSITISFLARNLTIFNIIRWVAGSMGQTSDVSSIIFFHNFLQNSFKNPFNLFSYNFTKIKIKSFECPAIHCFIFNPNLTLLVKLLF